MIGQDDEPDLGEHESVRVEHTRARRRLLYGRWEQDALRRMQSRLGAIRRAAVGYPDLSANPFRAICHQAAVLYDREPRISHPDDDQQRTLATALETRLRRAQWAPTMQRVQRDCIGLREMLLHVTVNTYGELVLRPVFPDRVVAHADDERPHQPAKLTEARRRVVGQQAQWTYDELDISGPSPTYRVIDSARRTITVATVGATASGDSYPWRWADGDPFLPYVLYHAAPTGRLWDPTELRELHEATYEVCVLWTFWGHCVRDASWPQRWAIDLTVQGATTEGGAMAPHQSVITDPSTLLLFTRQTGDLQGSATPPGQFSPGSDPHELAEALMIYEQRLASYAGVADPDFVRRSGDPRSGYALAISRDGQRAAARKFEPQFRAGDEELLAKACAALNRWREAGEGEDLDGVEPVPLPELPESGWRLTYPGLPLTPEEQDALRRDVLELLDRGLISRDRAYSRIHGIEPDEARAELAAIDQERSSAQATPVRPSLQLASEPAALASSTTEL